jgi:hypothetical protein
VTEPITPSDDVPARIRLDNGWFGNEPWPSGICYDEAGRLHTETRNPVPVGEYCIGCGEAIAEGDQGKASGMIALDGEFHAVHIHKECLLMEVLGPLGGAKDMTRRQQALSTWEWVQENGLSR